MYIYFIKTILRNISAEHDLRPTVYLHNKLEEDEKTHNLSKENTYLWLLLCQPITARLPRLRQETLYEAPNCVPLILRFRSNLK